MNVIVVGGGACGMMAAIHAKEQNTDVLLIEKNEKLGKKLYITGKGRCNITNAKDISGLLENIPTNPNFLYSSFAAFDSDDTIKLFNNLGVATKVERGGRVFPQSDKASTVVHALEKCIKNKNIKVLLNSTVKKLIINDSTVTGIILKDGKQFRADAVIISTGGLSYPQTGSTGDGYNLAKQAGHTISKLNPSLVPLKIREQWCHSLQGLSLKNVSIEIFKNNKTIYTDFGEMLFTHFGVSGPVIISASRHLIDKLDCTLKIDLKPALDNATLNDRLLREFAQTKNKDFKNALDSLLPQKLIPVIISLSEIPPDKKINMITKQERYNLIKTIKNLKCTITGTAGFTEAIITNGGIKTTEINPKTMESKKISGLYFCGEIIDVDGYTGGFNLQIAFSTGYIAGKSAILKIGHD